MSRSYASGFDLAQELISKNKRSESTFLDLSDCELSEIPREVGELPWLKELVLRNTSVSDLAPLTSLSALEALYLPRATVSDLTSLASLPNLQRLDISSTQVSDLAPLARLFGLQELLVSNTGVHDLAPLAGLSALLVLYASDTLISDLSPLVSLVRRGCPVKWSSNGYGNGIYVENCPLINPPPEIVKQGNVAVLNYFRERESGGVDHLFEAKMLIVGEGGAGKTSLLRRLFKPQKPLPNESESTKGIEIYRHEFKLLNGRTFRLNVWDFGGQEIYHATHQFFLTRRSLYVMVDDTRKDCKLVSDEGFKYWLDLIDVFGGHSPVLVFQNEKGGRSKAIDQPGIRGRYDNVKKFFAGNLERGDVTEGLRTDIEFFASNLNHIGEELPARWIDVRADIEALAGRPYITQQEYFEVYAQHLQFDRTRALHLSRYLHDLGVFLHFQDDPLLARTVILQNRWVTEAVFRILEDKSLKAGLGRFDETDCKRLWQDPAYAEMHPELLALMKNFELCYELRDSHPQTWLAPQLLPPAKPQDLADWGSAEDLVLRYRYEFLPKGMVSRLTVRLHRFVRSPEMAWVSGVLLERGSTAALVEILADGSGIQLRARGPERKALLSIIAADLDALTDSFQGLRDKVDKQVPCNCVRCSSGPESYFFSQKALLKRKDDNRLHVECPNSYEHVSVLELLDGVRIEKPGWANDEPAPKSVRTIRIFLASSAELREDRDRFDLYFRQLNDLLLKGGLYLEIVRWENFMDAMSETRLQDEYNRAIRACDICVCLFFTKVGKFTEEEFDAAYGQFKASGKPRIWTYFKTADVKFEKSRKDDFISLWALQEKLIALGHFQTGYDSIEHLNRKFRDQLDRWLATRSGE